jgi:RND family efflux transporter MFP subunit
VTVKTQINGQLTQIVFKEGQLVKKGDFLAQIDPRLYQAQLEQNQGQLARDQALLANAKLDLARYQKLAAQDSIAFQQVDTQQTTVKQDEGNVLVDQAQIDTAKVNLAYCHIQAFGYAGNPGTALFSTSSGLDADGKRESKHPDRGPTFCRRGGCSRRLRPECC